MTARERLLSARVLMSIQKNVDYANKIGVQGELKKNTKRKRRSVSTVNVAKGRVTVI